MNSVVSKSFQDCFVNFDGCCLRLGNSCFVREFDLSKNLLHTVSMKKSDGTVIASESNAPSDFYFYGDRCTPEEMNYQTPYVGACVVDRLYGTAPHLHVTVSLYEAFQQLTLRKDFYIYPELPALAMRCRIVSPVFPLAVWNCRRPVRERYQSRARSGLVFEGCVDRINPVSGFVPTECVEFRAQTDYNDEQIIHHPYTENKTLNGNLFYLKNQDQSELFYFQEAPPSEERRDLEDYDFRMENGEVISASWNLNPGELGNRKEWRSPRHVLFCCENSDDGERFLKEYLRRRYLPERFPHYITVNPWGDCDFYEKVSEKFLLDEVEAASQCGAELYQADDAWQSGGVLVDISGYNKLLSSKEFWQVNPALWQGDLTPVSVRCKEKTVDLSLWIAPFANVAYRDWKEMAEHCLELHQKYGVTAFKVDAINLVNSEAERNLELMLRTIRRRSKKQISFHFDVTAWGLRQGIYRFLEYGSVFLENRYTRIIRKALYHPERTWRNFWRLSRYARIQEILCEVPSPVNIDHEMYRAKGETPPDVYSWEYWLAISLFAQMLMWFSPSQLPEDLRQTAARFTDWRKKHDREILSSEVRRFGSEPDGTVLGGLYTVSDSPLLLALREKDSKESKIFVPCGNENTRWKLVFGNGTAVPCSGGVMINIPDAPGFAVWETEN
ncbi:MAG: hypothetical protein E7054_05215 [Lentisphaerae bacterium]|nr:hypothetical protein [Lentisphaerota bacterium]